MRPRRAAALVLVVEVLAAVASACAPARVPSLRSIGADDPDFVGYRISYLAMYDPAYLIKLDVLVYREHGSAHLEASVNEAPLHASSARHTTRTLTEGEWGRIEHCWDEESLLWSTSTMPGHQYGGLGWSGEFVVDAKRKRFGQYRSIRFYDGDRGPEARLHECAGRMISATGVAPVHMSWEPKAKWWWAEPEPAPCPDPLPLPPPGPELPSVSGFDGCPHGMTAPTTDLPVEGHSGSIAIRPFCLDVESVSVEQYLSCVRSSRCSAEHTRERSADGTHFECEAECNPRMDGNMVCVDWMQAAAYCAAQGKRLPTEDELRAGFGTTAWEWTGGVSADGRDRLLTGYTGVEGDNEHLGWADDIERHIRRTFALRDPAYRAEFLGFRCASDR